MLSPPRRNDLDSLFKEARVFKVRVLSSLVSFARNQKSFPGRGWALTDSSIRFPPTPLPQRAQRSKKFNLARNFQSRSNSLISLENFNLDVSNSPQKIGPRWVARSKISFSLEMFNLARNLDFFWCLGPLGLLLLRVKSQHQVPL